MKQITLLVCILFLCKADGIVQNPDNNEMIKVATVAALEIAKAITSEVSDVDVAGVPVWLLPSNSE
jgi:hypothetical protein